MSGNGNYNSGDFTPTRRASTTGSPPTPVTATTCPSTGTCGDQGETSTIGKQPTGISTAATSGTLGDAVHDIATLSGATANAGGTITFSLYGPSDTPDCSGKAVYTTRST